MKKSLFILALSTVFLTSCKDNGLEVKTETTAKTETAIKTKAIVGKIETASFNIEGMSCEIMCASKIQKELTATDGVQNATVDFDNKLATIEYDSAVTSPEKLIELVEAVNGGDSYKVSNLKTSADHASLYQEKEKKKSRKDRKAAEQKSSKETKDAKTAKPGCCSEKKACSDKKETM